MANFCTACGAKVRADLRFCTACGVALRAAPAAAAPATVSGRAPLPAPFSDEPNAAMFARPRSEAVARRAGPQPNQRILAIVGSVALLAVLAVGAGLLLTRKPAAATVAQVQTLYVNRLLHLRNAPTPIGSAIVGDLHRGDAVTGVIMTGTDSVTQWLKISTNGQPDRYAWARNLSPLPRPPLLSNAESDEVLSDQTPVMGEPSDTATQIDTDPAGATAHILGTTEGGWSEVALLRGGGVGYIKASTPPVGATDASWPVEQSSCNDVACLLQDMRQRGASPVAIDLAQRLSAPTGETAWPRWAHSIIAYGPIRLIVTDCTGCATGGFALADAASNIWLAPGEMQSATLERFIQASPFVRQNHPNALITRYGHGFLGRSLLPTGGQRFTFIDDISDCEACNPFATLQYAMDFDPQGKPIGRRVLGFSGADVKSQVLHPPGH